MPGNMQPEHASFDSFVKRKHGGQRPGVFAAQAFIASAMHAGCGEGWVEGVVFSMGCRGLQ